MAAASVGLGSALVGVQPRLLLLEQKAVVGVLEGNPDQEFGWIKDAATDRQGLLYMLDSRLRSVRVFDRKGKMLAKAGRRGFGPGEYEDPRSFALVDSATAVVYDPGTQRVSTLRRGGTGLQFAESFRVDMTAFDMCVMGRRVFVLGFHGGRTVHVFDLAGRHMQSFGRRFGPAHPVLERSLSRGHITCIPEKGLVVVTSGLIPEVRAYRIDGAEIWSHKLAGYRQVVIEQKSAGSITYSHPRGRHHLTMSLLSLSPDLLVVQFGVVKAGSKNPEDLSDMETHFLSTDGGRLKWTQTALPMFVSASPPHIVAVDNQVVPQARVFRFRIVED